MSIKTRVKKLEDKSNDDFRIVMPVVTFFDKNERQLWSSADAPEGYKVVDAMAASVRGEMEGVEPVVLSLEEGEDPSNLRQRIHPACQKAFHAAGMKGICVSFEAKWL